MEADVCRPAPAMRNDLIGVIGGMGPLATVDFLKKLVEVTPAKSDQDHVPVIVLSDPRIPDRTKALLEGGESPVPMLLAAARALEAAGAKALVIPCNTAHAWEQQIRLCVGITVISMIDAVFAEVESRGIKRLGLMSTRGTRAAAIYRRVAQAQRIALVEPDDEVQRWIDQGISAVKSGQIASARVAFADAFEALISSGAQNVALACTEIPIGMTPHDPRGIDSTYALAQAAFAWSEARRRRAD
jgi:aspartate racemase